jgi:hypothetical protein
MTNILYSSHVSKTLSHLVFERIKFQKSCAGWQSSINRLIALIIKMWEVLLSSSSWNYIEYWPKKKWLHLSPYNAGSVAQQLMLKLHWKLTKKKWLHLSPYNVGSVAQQLKLKLHWKLTNKSDSISLTTMCPVVILSTCDFDSAAILNHVMMHVNSMHTLPK